MNLTQRLDWLKARGCYPSIYRRGNLWRAHVNAAGNYWGEEKTAREALEIATEAWVEAGCPADGIAATVSLGA